jgi:hypothetical protein
VRANVSQASCIASARAWGGASPTNPTSRGSAAMPNRNGSSMAWQAPSAPPIAGEAQLNTYSQTSSVVASWASPRATAGTRKA